MSMSPFEPPEIVDNLILRVEGCEGVPHPELEAAGPQCPGMWTKDYDVFSIESGEAFIAALRDAARIASEVSSGKTYLHIEPAGETIFRLPPSLLSEMAEASCTLEVFCAEA